MSTPSTPRTVNELFPSRWINHADLNGKTFVLTIREVTIEQVRDKFGGGDMVHKGVVWFERAEKGLVLNHTQASAIAAICKSETFTDWVGKRIMLSAGRAHNGKPTIVVTAVKETMV